MGDDCLDVAIQELADGPPVQPLAEIYCPECGAAMVLRRSKRFTWTNGEGRLFYGCSRWPLCNAAHGAHPDGRPLGIPGGKKTNLARQQAHAMFDRLVKRRHWHKHGAYLWLGRRLRIPEEDIRNKCHIAMFDEEMCQRVVDICGKALAATEAGS